MRSMYIGATGMIAQQRNVEIISNNLANMNTTAFKRHRSEFQDLLYQDYRRPGDTSSADGTVVPTGIQSGLGVKLAAVYRVNEEGPVNPTGNTFDLAVQGKGYFQVDLPNGDTGYTRDGAFQLNANGELVTHDGYTVQPGITIPQNVTDVNINSAGEVLVHVDGQSKPQNLGQIQLATFANEAGLHAEGGNMYTETDASGAPTSGSPSEPGKGSILQSFLETSNVNSVTEVTALISAQRAYEMNSKTITIASAMEEKVTQLR